MITIFWGKAMRKGNPPVRIWEEVYQIYKTVAQRYGIVLTDLVSAILLEVAYHNKPLVLSTLLAWFNIELDEAIEISTELESLGRTIVDNFLSEEEKEEQKEEVLARAT